MRHADEIIYANSDIAVAFVKDPDYAYYFIDLKNNSIVLKGYNVTHYQDASKFAYSAGWDDIYGFIDNHGNIICEPYLAGGGSLHFCEGISGYNTDGLTGFINTELEFIAESKYDQTRDFLDGYAAVCKEEKWGYIDTSGNEVIPLQYDYENPFSSGVVLVMLNNEWFFIDMEGNTVY